MNNAQIFVNLPVQDLPRSRAFFEALGYSFNPQFSNDSGACLVISDNIFAMLLTHDFFQTFIQKKIVDAHQSTEVLVCLSCSSRAEVDALVSKAIARGGKPHGESKDHGFMYAHGFEDLDGHIWELVHMSGMPPEA